MFKTLTEQLALRLIDSQTGFDFIAANATGGMITGYQLRELGFPAENAATILHYHNPEALERLREMGIVVVELTNLPKLIKVAEEFSYFSPKAIKSYRDFLQNPLRWQSERGLEPVKI